jgi:hypothetical protein
MACAKCGRKSGATTAETEEETAQNKRWLKAFQKVFNQR